MIDDISTYKTPDQILGDIERTKESLTEKLGELDSEVRTIASEATSTVWNALTAALEKLRPSHLIRRHHWPFFVGSVGLGFAIALALLQPASTPEAEQRPVTATGV